MPDSLIPAAHLRVDSLTTEAIAGSAHPHFVLRELLKDDGIEAINVGVARLVDRTQSPPTVEQIRQVIDDVVEARNAAQEAGGVDPTVPTVPAAPARQSMFDDPPMSEGPSGPAGFPAPKTRPRVPVVERVVWDVADSVLDMESVHNMVFLVRAELLLAEWRAQRLGALEVVARIEAAVAERADAIGPTAGLHPSARKRPADAASSPEAEDPVTFA